MTRRPVAVSWTPPPWLWLILALYVAQLPGRISWWAATFDDFTGRGAYPSEVTDSDGFLALAALSSAQVLPVVLLFASAAGVLAPGLRRRVIERWYGLEVPDTQDDDVLRDITKFVTEQAPGTELRVNLIRRDQIARVYPGGPRSTRIAVFTPLIVLWRKDPDAARAVLLHELGHQSGGEQHVAGLGGAFAALVRHWPWLFGLFAVLPLVMLLAAGNPTAQLMPAQMTLIVFAVPHALVVPVAALWCSELTADRHAASAFEHVAMAEALANIEKTAPRGRARLHHPPVRLRRWFLARADRTYAHAALMLIFPVAVAVDALIAFAGALIAYRWLGTSWLAGADSAWAFTDRELTDGPQWWAVAACLVVWPVAARGWRRVWGWREGSSGAAGLPLSRRAYAAAAVLPLTAITLGLATTSDDQSQAASTSTQGPSTTPDTSPRQPRTADPSSCPSPTPPAPPTRPAGLPATAGLGAVTDAQLTAAAGTFRTTTVVRSEPLLNSSATTSQRLQDRYRPAHWTLDTNGTLTGTATGDPPLQVTAADGNTLVLHGSQTATTSVSATTTWLDARLDLSPGRAPELTLVRATTTVSHAVVNCTAFDQTNTSAGRVVLLLDRQP